MAIQVTCPGCGRSFKVIDAAAGKKGACQACGTMLVVPERRPESPGETSAPPSPRPGWKPGAVFPVASIHSGPVHSVRFNYGGSTAISAGDDATVRLWDVAAGAQSMELAGHAGPVRSAVLGPDGNFALSGGDDRTVRIWNLHTGKCIRVLEGHGAPVMSVAFNPRGVYAVSADSAGEMRYWALASGRCERSWEGHEGGAACVDMEPTGECVVSGGRDRLVKLWRAKKGKLIDAMKGHGSGVTSVAFNFDGTLVVSGGEDRVAALWDVPKARAVMSFRGHSAPVRAVSLSPRGTYLATASSDWSLGVWEVASGERRWALEGEREPVTAVSFGRGRRIAAGYGDGAIRLWDADAGTLVRAFGGGQDCAAARCPACGRIFYLPNALLGAEGKCPGCAAAFTAMPYSPREALEAARRGAAFMQSGQFDRAAAEFARAARLQGDNYDALLNSLVCTRKWGGDLLAARDYARAVDAFESAIGLLARGEPWPVALSAQARREAYDATFQGGKTCRAFLGDNARAARLVEFAQRLNNTMEVQDILARLR